MKLFYRKIGEGHPFIILHGLYGSSDNWVSIARRLSEYYTVWLIDARNHGHSPHCKNHNYKVMADDLKEFVIEHQLDKAIILGHSMGGKTTMFFADWYPQFLSHLIVIDIAPKSYLFSLETGNDALSHKKIMKGMMALDFQVIRNRDEVFEILSGYINNEIITQFLMKNIKRNPDMTFNWRLNIKALYANLENILAAFIPLNKNKIDKFPALFVKGSESEYISEEDKDEIYSVFPEASFVTIPDAGHWLHIEQPELLIRTLKDFLFRIDSCK